MMSPVIEHVRVICHVEGDLLSRCGELEELGKLTGAEAFGGRNRSTDMAMRKHLTFMHA